MVEVVVAPAAAAAVDDRSFESALRDDSVLRGAAELLLTLRDFDLRLVARLSLPLDDDDDELELDDDDDDELEREPELRDEELLSDELIRGTVVKQYRWGEGVRITQMDDTEREREERIGAGKGN